MRFTLLLSVLCFCVKAQAQTQDFRITVFNGNDMPYHEEVTKPFEDGAVFDVYYYQRQFGLPGYLPPADLWFDSLHAEASVFSDLEGNLTESRSPEGGAEFRYNPKGQLEEVLILPCAECLEKPNQYSFAYDPQGRVISITYSPRGKLQFTYRLAYDDATSVRSITEVEKGEPIQNVSLMGGQ